MKNIKNIIFDFDGVLIKNTKILLETHRKTLGPFSEENFRKLFNGNTAEELEKHKIKNMNLFWDEWKKILENWIIDQETLNFLKNNKKNNFIISSNKEYILNKILENSNIENLFLDVLGSETHKLKTKKFILLKEKFNLNFKETVFITDSLGDLKEASEFPELKTIGVTWGVHCRKNLKKGIPDFISDSWDEIKKILN